MKHIFNMAKKQLNFRSVSLDWAVCLLTLVILLSPHVLKAEDVLKLLVWEGYAPAEKVKQFENLIKEKYGKPVRLEVRQDVSDPQAFFDTLRENNGAHIVSPSHNLIKDERFSYIKKQLIMEIDVDQLSNYKNLLGPLQKADYISENNKVYGVPLAHGPYGLAYNTKYFKEAPKSWKVLWDPQWKGKYAISSDYYEVNVYVTAMTLGFEKNLMYSYDALNSSDDFKNKLQQLAQNAHKFWVGVDKPDDLKGLALATTWGFSLSELEKQGEVWKMADPIEGYTGWVDGFVVARRGIEDNPFLKKVAMDWLNYVISPEYQVDVVVRQLGSDPVNVHITDRLTPQEISKHHLDNPDYFLKNRILWPTVSVRARNGMKSLWQSAMKTN